MSIVVVGCGRSGTNMILEMLTGAGFFKASHPAENRRVFKSGEQFPNNYLTKCDTAYFDTQQMMRTIERNPHMKIVWTIRDPRDMAMSKMRRGVSKAQGGDCPGLADDATPRGCVRDLEKMKGMYEYSRIALQNRMITIRMEDAIANTKKITQNLADFAGIPWKKNMVFFYNRMRVPEKRERYKGIDKSQIALWKNWKTVYDGWFVNNKINMEIIFDQIEHVTKYFEHI